MPTKPHAKQIITNTALTNLGNASGDNLDQILPNIDAATLATINEVNTGFMSWTGAGNYYSVTGGNTFNLLRGGSGYIKNKLVSFSGGQSVTLTANKTGYIYIDSTGIIGKINNDTVSPSTYEDNVVLFEALYDGTNVIVTKDNHPYSFPSKLGTYLHYTAGIVVRSTGSVIGKLGTGTGGVVQDRQIISVGADVLDDHGVTTVIPDSSAIPLTVNYMYKNATGQWIKYATQNTIPFVYAPAGVITAVSAGNYQNMAFYVSKDDLNGTNPIYFAILDTVIYATAGTASTAVTNGNLTLKSNELDSLELAQLGYITSRNQGGGYISSVIVSKSTFNSKLIGGGASVTSHLLLGDLNGGPFLDGGHSNLLTFKTSASIPSVTDDGSSFKPGSRWRCSANGVTYQLIDATIGAAVWEPEGKKSAIAYSIVFG